MSNEQRVSDLEQRFEQQTAELADMRSALQALQTGATDAKRRADDSEAQADNSDHRADVSEARADKAELRAEDSQDRADAHGERMDAFEERLDVDEAMIADLQADGLLSQEHAKQLEQALRSSRLIGAAMGIIMANRHVNEADAFRLLSKSSQTTNRKLRVIAEQIVRTGDASSLASG